MDLIKNKKKINIGITGHRGVIGTDFITLNKKFNFITFDGNLTNKQSVYNWIKNNSFEALIHFAAIVPIQDVEKNFSKAKKVNYGGTKHLVDAIIKFKPKNLGWFFYASTSHVYKGSNKKLTENSKKIPITRYGLTKLLAENYILKKTKKTKILFCIGRIFSYFHHRQKSSYFIQNVFKKIYEKNKKKITFYGLNQYRDILGSKDVCDAINFLYKKKAKGIYNIASGKKTKLLKVVNILAKSKNIKIVNKDNLYSKKFKNINIIGDIKKIRKIGWRPKDSLNYVLKNYLKNKLKK